MSGRSGPTARGQDVVGLAGRWPVTKTATMSVLNQVREAKSGPIHRSMHSSGQTGLAEEPLGLVSGGDRRAVAGQAGLTRLRRFSGWPARMRPRAIASMIVSAMLMRSCIFASPRMPGRSNPKPPANRLLTRSTAPRWL